MTSAQQTASTLPAPPLPAPPPDSPVATCGCGRAYDWDAWQALTTRRPWELVENELLEIAECVCTSTISRRLT